MTYPELFLLAVGLSFDTFAVSFCGGLKLREESLWRRWRIPLVFALFQSGFTWIGWLLGMTVLEYIAQVDHWIAASLLGYIGGKMLWEGFRKQESCESAVDLGRLRYLATSGVATSIDALAVGISFAVVDPRGDRLPQALLIIALVTAAASLAGLFGGNRMGRCLGHWSGIAGGIILIVIGIKILAEHLMIG